MVGVERVAWLSFFEDVAFLHCPFDSDQRVVAAEVLREMQARCRDHAEDWASLLNMGFEVCASLVNMGFRFE